MEETKPTLNEMLESKYSEGYMVGVKTGAVFIVIIYIIGYVIAAIINN
jgi:hypothetical protein